MQARNPGLFVAVLVANHQHTSRRGAELAAYRAGDQVGLERALAAGLLGHEQRQLAHRDAVPPQPLDAADLGPVDPAQPKRLWRRQRAGRDERRRLWGGGVEGYHRHDATPAAARCARQTRIWALSCAT